MDPTDRSHEPLHASAVEDPVSIPLYGEVDIQPGWRVFDQGSGGGEKKPFHWLVLQKGADQEFLSFFVASRSRMDPDSGKDGSLIYLSDTAGELFSDGRWAPSRPEDAPTSLIWPIRNDVVKFMNHEVLEHSFVTEFDGEQANMMSHGYVLVGDVIVFVQHTSEGVITDEIARRYAGEVQTHLKETSDPKNLREFKE